MRARVRRAGLKGLPNSRGTLIPGVVATLVAAGLLAAAGPAAAARPASALGLQGPSSVAGLATAAGYDGYCRTASGTTVVVDFQQLGGGVVVRCAASLSSGASGVDALVAAGVPFEGVHRYGDAFICRLYDRPSASVSLPVSGTGYHEQCIDTPPATAYWSYWSATNGGRWTYSQYGARDRAVVPGGFEGWSFALNATSATAPAPRVRPLRPAAATRPATPSSQPTAAHSSTPAAPSTPARHGLSSVSGGSRSLPHRAAGSSEVSRAASATKAPSAGPPSAHTGTGTGTSTSTPPSRSGTTSQLVVSSGDLPRTPPAQGSSPATLAGAGLLAFLVAAGVGTAWRRRRS